MTSDACPPTESGPWHFDFSELSRKNYDRGGRGAFAVFSIGFLLGLAYLLFQGVQRVQSGGPAATGGWIEISLSCLLFVPLVNASVWMALLKLRPGADSAVVSGSEVSVHFPSGTVFALPWNSRDKVLRIMDAPEDYKWGPRIIFLDHWFLPRSALSESFLNQVVDTARGMGKDVERTASHRKGRTVTIIEIRT